MKKFKGMDLQLFAEELEQEVEVEDVETEEVEDVEQEADLLDLLEKDENIQKQFQSEMDRAIQRAIATRDKKHKEELKKQEQRANMTASELQAEKERELEEREQKLHEYELKLAKIEYFKENNVPLELVDYVSVDSKDDIEENAKVLTNLIDDLVEKEVKNRLKSSGTSYSEQEEPIDLKNLSNLTPEEINAQWDKLV